MSHRFSLACQLLSWYWQHGDDVEKDSVLVGSLKQKRTQDSDALGLLGEEFPEKGSKGSQMVHGRSYMKMDSQQQPSFSVIWRLHMTHISELVPGPLSVVGGKLSQMRHLSFCWGHFSGDEGSCEPLVGDIQGSWEKDKDPCWWRGSGLNIPNIYHSVFMLQEWVLWSVSDVCHGHRHHFCREVCRGLMLWEEEGLN